MNSPPYVNNLPIAASKSEGQFVPHVFLLHVIQHTFSRISMENARQAELCRVSVLLGHNIPAMILLEANRWWDDNQKDQRTVRGQAQDTGAPIQTISCASAVGSPNWAGSSQSANGR
jgi:hypothetical protein